MSGHQPDRPASVNDNRLSRLHTGEFCGVPTSGENIRQHHVITLLVLSILGKLQTIEVGVRHTEVFGLPAAVRSHAGESVGSAGRSGIREQTGARQTAFTVLAEAARNVERKTNPVADLDPVHRSAHLHDLAKILVAEDSAFLHIGPPFDMCRSEPQMLVLVIFTSTSVGRSIFASGTFFTCTSRGPL